jgi:hypothetical protein
MRVRSVVFPEPDGPMRMVSDPRRPQVYVEQSLFSGFSLAEEVIETSHINRSVGHGASKQIGRFGGGKLAHGQHARDGAGDDGADEDRDRTLRCHEDRNVRQVGQ